MIVDIIPSLPAPKITFSFFILNRLESLVLSSYPEASGYRWSFFIDCSISKRALGDGPIGFSLEANLSI